MFPNIRAYNNNYNRFRFGIIFTVMVMKNELNNLSSITEYSDKKDRCELAKKG